jgi:hypothetical protein
LRSLPLVSMVSPHSAVEEVLPLEEVVLTLASYPHLSFWELPTFVAGALSSRNHSIALSWDSQLSWSIDTSGLLFK